MCTRETTKGGRVFDEPFVAMNRAYVEAHPLHDWSPLYSQATVDTLRAQLEAANEELRGYRLHVASFGKHVASVGCEYRQPFEDEEGDYLFNVRAEAAEARAEAAEAECARLREDAERYAFLKDVRKNPYAFLPVGFGLDLHIDAAMARTKEQQA